MADKNHDGLVDLEEALQHNYGEGTEFSESEMARQANGFDSLDTNKDTFLDSNEIDPDF